MPTLINAYGVAYGAGDVKVTMLGRTLDGITKIAYGSSQTKENLYGMGREPLQRGRGRKEYTASITLKAFEIDAIQKAARDQDICNIAPFNIVVTYLDVATSSIKIDVLENVEFTGDQREIASDTLEVESECELVVGGITRKNK